MSSCARASSMKAAFVLVTPGAVMDQVWPCARRARALHRTFGRDFADLRRSDDHPVRNDPVLRDDDQPLADVVAVAVLFLDALRVHQAHAAADAGVLVDDGVLDD